MQVHCVPAGPHRPVVIGKPKPDKRAGAGTLRRLFGERLRERVFRRGERCLNPGSSSGVEIRQDEEERKKAQRASPTHGQHAPIVPNVPLTCNRISQIGSARPSLADEAGRQHRGRRSPHAIDGSLIRRQLVGLGQEDIDA